MKLIWKGKFVNEEQLPKADLPEDAVIFKEPDTPEMLNIIASIFIIPALLIIGLAICIKILIGSGFQVTINFIGFFFAVLCVLPHEFLHAITYPKHAEVQIWYSFKKLIAFVTSTYPTTKIRFILISLMPSIVFGLTPLIIWILLPRQYANTSDILFTFASINILLGVGDYLNVYNALLQMPKGSMTQLSGFHSYWFFPQNK